MAPPDGAAEGEPTGGPGPLGRRSGGAPAAASGGGAGRAGVLRRFRWAAATEPGGLRLTAAVLAVAAVLFGAVACWQMAQRAEAADGVVERSQPLSADAAKVHRALADAGTTASAGFLAGGDEPRELRRRYDRDVADASRLLTKAASNSESSPSARRQISKLNQQLPVYTGLVEAARANNRQGLPLGGAYLRHANDKLRTEMLPAARKLYTAETARLNADYAAARAWPWLAMGLGVAVVAALGWAQRREYRRTNRVVSPGLAGATAASLALLVWLSAGHAVARAQLDTSDVRGARSLQALNAAWIGALQARGDENMAMVARGAGEEYERSFRREVAGLVGKAPDWREGTAGRLNEALRLADDERGRKPVRAVRKALREWDERHAEARERDAGGSYDAALTMVIGEKGSTRESFERVDAGLAEASAHEQREFERAAEGGRGALAGLPLGAVVLAVLGAGAALWGIGRRLAEYR
ncbi:hypothetical protein E0L36_02450 [Streptomyces sp. AJS327]|nr:hypothetical protein [Streptomyces sp. AJS327]